MARRALVAAVAIVALTLGLHWLVRASVTRHEDVAANSTLVVALDVETRSGAEHPPLEMLEGLVALCRLEVAAGVVPGSIESVGGERFTFRLEPSLDAADQRQFRGCLEDVRVDGLLANDVTMTSR